ncbi:MAG TPA: cobalamin-binding protein [Bradyrhizobium sp.]|uniref:cobalamin-binding protein n=1 Tax=Bradyrhizobium sp. TaxID=376 RepID=UPI002D7F6F01|nr:cobalamin-binding protein [Bradyrhizobium sp.]HET7887059.1 cobalamin-binding protein [Bradyrhizobium sp.]
MGADIDNPKFLGGLEMVEARRIVSFLPSATEMACALGLSEQLLGITHECDYPPQIAGKPVVVRAVLPIESMSQAEIDVAVTQRLRDGLSLYRVEETLMQDIAPDLILTQDLCQVCAPSGNEISQLLTSLPSKPQVLWLTPRNIEEIFDNLRELGEATGRSGTAEELIADGSARLAKIEAATRALSSRPRVFCMEWMDPVYCCGHWVPEMVRIAGGVDELGREGSDSVRVPWRDVLDWQPEVLIVMPCGFDLQKAVDQARMLTTYPGWDQLPAVRNGRAYAVDANSYFARPGPRVIEGTELLAHLLHPETFEWKGPGSAFRPLA